MRRSKMRKLTIGITALAALSLGSAAVAGPGQCYDGHGRPFGPAYDTDRPDYNWINSVLKRGGSCTGVVGPSTPGGYHFKTEPKYYAPQYDWKSDHGRTGQSHRDAERDRKTQQDDMKNNPCPRC